MPAHQQYFEVLGLDGPPADRKTVKRAYSKMLKVTRPEDDPDGFMRLRDAHDQALNILKWRAEDDALRAQETAPEPVSKAEPETAADIPDPIINTSPEPGLTYGDMLPAFEPEPVSETSYSIGPTPNFDAPVTLPEPIVSQAPVLIHALSAMLGDPNRYNDREEWNVLFRKARQLDIDSYINFESSLLDSILNFYEYNHPNMLNEEYPGRLPELINQSISASLFKTMNWDNVNTRDYHKNMQLEWLARRMRVRHVRGNKSNPLPAPNPNTKSEGNGKVWMYIIGFFILIKIIQALANA